MKLTYSDIELDIHTHTIASGHAYGTLTEMAQSAAVKGLKLLGISEHSEGIPGTCSHIYFANIEVIPRNLYGVEMAIGAEINILNGCQLSMEDRIIERLDYGIAGIHDLCYTVGTMEENTENTLHAIRHPGVHVISHPDDSKCPLNYEKLVKACKEHKTLLEINNSSFRKPDRRLNCHDNYREILRLCRQMETPVILGSDAHFPTDVFNFDFAVEFLNQMDFPKELVINTSRDWFFDFVKESWDVNS